MKLTLSKLVQGAEALGRLSKEKVSGKLAYRMSRDLRLINQELTTHNEARTKLLEQYGTAGAQSPQGVQYSFENGNAELFFADMNELEATEIELDIHPLTETDIENIQCTAEDLLVLEWMIEEAKA
jgi:hypothetical protein